MRALGVLLLVACTGTSTSKDSGSDHSGSVGCRTTDDCLGSSGEYCFAPGEPNCPVLQSCDGTTCPTDQLCLPADPVFEPCADAVCRDACADDAGCRAGVETCDVTSGACRPIPCDAGFACAAHEACVPGAPLHGCVRDACADDAACAGGRCVKGSCYDALGTCGFQAEN